MKAVVFHQPGDASVLQIEDREIPSPRRNEVLIKVRAAGMNRADIAQRRGNYPAPEGTVQDILGLEVSGIIHKKGDAVKQWNIGDEVCALLPGGGYAEYAVADAGSCLPIPSGFCLKDAAALPEVLFTVWQTIFQRGALQKDEIVMIYGGSGGIGSMAIQLVHLYGSKVIAVAGSEEKENYCNYLGAYKTVNYKKDDLLEQLSPNTIDVILDSVGGQYLETNLGLLKKEGRLVYINAMNGGFPKLNIFKMMQKRISIAGATLRMRSSEYKERLALEILKNAYPLIEHKDFKNLVRNRLPFTQVAEAHALMDSRAFFGKIILCF